ncbi:ABC transporter ATP-binding protein [Candidatus Nomurabacteria bacterium]|nr:ABC transporter ATP-binding protein [Candidatus Saccharibacteria bacterium]MCA9313715.1 ABC transporter ATP-binding protein [Candidatus Saccharibacteria bacterium]MCB9822547.1 ABC transporter ATP-binding protein [Candidatus Nomurabacteria bacterium]
MNVIEMNQISRSFGMGNGTTTALEGIDLIVPKGEFLVIMGSSGSGKSTLLNIIGLLDQADQGEYLLDGKDVAFISQRKQAKIRRNNIGFIFQSFNLIGRMNILENVSLPLLYKGVSTVKRLERASEILKYLGIQEKEYYFPNQLSGGQLQRAAIARAMVNRPSIVLADEPTGNLDTKASKVIMAALQEIHQAGNTIIMVTHNPDLAVYADRVINMEDGKIVEEFVGKSMTKEIKELQDEAEEIVEPATSLAIEPTAKREKTKVRNKKGKNTKKTSSKEAKNA